MKWQRWLGVKPLLTWTLVGLIVSARAQDAIPSPNPSGKISQIVIVYAPNRDWNGAFGSFDENLTRLIAAARARGLRVVLINTDHFEGPNANELIKKSLQGAVAQHPSLVMLATHGGDAKNGEQSDTSLSFAEGIAFSDLSTVFENQANLKGVVLQACHSGNDKLRLFGKQALACGSSPVNSTAPAVAVDAYNNVISSAIRAGKVDDLAAYVRGGMLAQIEQMSPDSRTKMLGPQEDASKFPVFGPKGMEVEFAGDKHEIVDPFGNPITPCYYPTIERAPDLASSAGEKIPWLKASREKRIASLPSRTLPDGALSNLVLSHVSTNLSNFYFETYSQNVRPQQNLRAECTDKGEIVVRGAASKTACFGGVKVKVGETCGPSLAPAFKQLSQVYGTPATPTTLKLENTTVTDQFCQSLDKDFAELRAAGIRVEVEDLCIETQCRLPTVWYPIGTCTPSGTVCTPTPKGAFLLKSKECLGLSNYAELSKDPCRASDGNLAKDGSCFIPAHPTGLRLPMKLDSRLHTKDNDEVFRTLHQQVASFECRDGKATYSEECCTKNNGVPRTAQDVDEKMITSGMDDTQAQAIWLNVVVMSQNRCEKKADFYQPAPGGASGPLHQNQYPGSGMSSGYGYGGGYGGGLLPTPPPAAQ
ncbi:MAG TPA: hypothetical protein VM901_09080 [Bdellovibrionota bacterium]|jgi:hypothetical protein|nr:hypothetical protein [Bdellovibrionota bacterium]